MKFNIGQRVRFVKAGMLDWESMDWIGRTNLVLNNIYTIDSIEFSNEIGSGIKIRTCEPHFSLSHNHFEFVDEKQNDTNKTKRKIWIINLRREYENRA
jgi:hypothetical protein